MEAKRKANGVSDAEDRNAKRRRVAVSMIQNRLLNGEILFQELSLQCCILRSPLRIFLDILFLLLSMEWCNLHPHPHPHPSIL